MLIDNISNYLQTVLRGEINQSRATQDDLRRLLDIKNHELQNQHENVAASISRRLAEISGDPNRDTEREALASTWYRRHSINFDNWARFYRTRLELTRLNLITQTDFSDGNLFSNRAAEIAKVADDECLWAINQIYSQQMSDCQKYCEQIAGNNPLAGDLSRQSAINGLRSRQFRQPVLEVDVAQATDDHAALYSTIQQLGELRRAWDQILDPDSFATSYLEGRRDQIRAGISAFDKSIADLMTDIHSAAVLA